MKYSKTNINGNAGEHLVASRIIYYFGFPCRLQNIDIGIDAEIEITDKDLRSTGNIVKAQIKSTESDQMSIYISGKHIRYWNNLNFPVIIILVHLKRNKIFWHCVDNIEEYNFSNSGYKIEFDAENELRKSSKERFIEISLFPLKQQIIAIYKKAFQLAQEDMKVLESDDYDLVTYEFIADNYFSIKFNLEKVDEIIRRNTSLKSVEEDYREELKLIVDYFALVNKDIEVIESDRSDHFEHLRSRNYDWDELLLKYC